jgi:ribonuclease BN (tRNA processing enzyme)
MELTVVGCSGSTSGPASPASCYLVQAPFDGRTFSLVLDLGPGAFGHLYRYLDPSEVDAVALSHLHPDHCLDLCAYYVAATYSPTAPWPRRRLYGPAGTAGRLARAYDVAALDGTGGQEVPGIAQHFDHQSWRAVQQVGPFTIRTARVEHPVEAYGLRIEDNAGGASLVFSGDTGPCEALTELAAGVDLLLVESAFMDALDNPVGLHLSGRQAAQTATAAKVGSVVLTHIPPWHDPQRVLAEAAPYFDGPVLLAEPGAHWTIGRGQD